jgi:DNA-binding HxlR family transcriptional regulator
MSELKKSWQVMNEDCPLWQMFDLVGDRWSGIILFVIGDDVKRYSDLQKQISLVSKKMLTQTLRNLERDGLVQRKVYAVIPPKTEYRLTKLGKSILKPIRCLTDWAVKHQKDLRDIQGKRHKVDGSTT